MATRREFLGMVAGAAAVGAVAPLLAAAGTSRAADAVTFNSVEELQLFQYAAQMAAYLWRELHWPDRRAPPLSPARREAMINEWAALNREQFEYKMMRLNRPDIVDSPETLAELARRDGVSVEQVRFLMPWHRLPEEPFVVLPPDGEFLTTVPDGVMLYVASTSNFQAY
jgi:hypothetical protein